eukprot:14689062-Ditylum_brightwellii.AAC.1
MVGNEKHFHSHPWESLAATWASNKCRHFLWGRMYTLITDQYALKRIMSYKGNNHAVVRLQMELLNMFFMVVHRPGNMLEDANYLSRLGENVHINPLMKHYLEFVRQMYIKNTPPTGEVNQDNLPGRRQKKQRVDRESLMSINLAQVHFPAEERAHIKHSVVTEIPWLTKRMNTPVVFINVPRLQGQSTHHFSHVVDTASTLASVPWAFFNPAFGHFLQAAEQTGHKCDPIFVIETDRDCRDVLQTRWNISTIFSTISAAVLFLTKAKPAPVIRAYHAAVPSDYSRSDLQTWCSYQSILIDPLVTRSHLLLIVIESIFDLTTSVLMQLSKGAQ